MAHGTFNYSPSAVQGGGKFQQVHQGPRPEGRDGLIAEPPSREGVYVTRQLERQDWATCQALAQIRMAQRAQRGIEMPPLGPRETSERIGYVPSDGEVKR